MTRNERTCTCDHKGIDYAIIGEILHAAPHCLLCGLRVGPVPPFEPDDEDEETSPTTPAEEPPVDDTARARERVLAWLAAQRRRAVPDPPDPLLAPVREALARASALGGCQTIATVAEALAHAGLMRVRLCE